MAYHIYWWEHRDNTFKNFGDLVGPFLVEKMTGRKPIRVPHPSMRRYKYGILHYLTAGSIISEANSNSVVWGSGIIYRNQSIRPATFLSVRGPLTRNRLMQLGYSCPKVFGDPALLLPLYLKKNSSKKYKLGIIPHYVDYEAVKAHFESRNHVKVINLKTSNIENVIDQICLCEKIISSSLHGLIVPQAYGIPTIWIQFSKNLGGDNTKFYDYLLSVGIKGYITEMVTVTPTFEKDLLHLFDEKKRFSLPEKKKITEVQQNLLSKSPFLYGKWDKILLRIKVKINLVIQLLK